MQSNPLPVLTSLVQKGFAVRVPYEAHGSKCWRVLLTPQGKDEFEHMVQ
jgi:DNA-binding MarR family transcriptional regulator